MARRISIGAQGFAELRASGSFYVDKTSFISAWWNSGDVVTSICRPRRFGKTLNMSMVECFFSLQYAGRGQELFGGLDVWHDSGMVVQQGMWPVVYVSFAGAKGSSFDELRLRMCEQVAQAWRTHRDLLTTAEISAYERELAAGAVTAVDPALAPASLQRLCDLLYQATGHKAIVLLDEYDTPMQEAWLLGCWDEAATFQRALFNNTFKTNAFLERGLMTGVTRVSRESIFSDLNNLEVVTATSEKYETAFGFTEGEVLAALDEFGLDGADEVRRWYDGFTFGRTPHIYNPWSITNYLDKGVIRAYWANTSSNALVSSLVRESGARFKSDFETLLAGGTLRKSIDEQVVFSQLNGSEEAVWSLLVAGGYLRASNVEVREGETACDLALTNREVRSAFDRMVRDWFAPVDESYGEFVRALLAGDLDALNAYLGDVALAVMSSFDSGTRASAFSQPERFWHGLVLGLLVSLRGRYEVTSNRESGFGRCDVMLVPLAEADPAVIIEFKVAREDRGETLEDAVAAAHEQIEERAYATALVERGIARERILTYGIAFAGKRVLVG